MFGSRAMILDTSASDGSAKVEKSIALGRNSIVLGMSCDLNEVILALALLIFSLKYSKNRLHIPDSKFTE